MSQHGVLIISDDTEFVRAVAARWQSERHMPAITAVSSDIWNRSNPEGYDLAILGAVRNAEIATIVAVMGSSLICVAENHHDASSLRARYPQLAIVPRDDGWMDTLVLVAGEALRRKETLARAQRAERLAYDSQSHATLGRYMLEMRHNVNDALTSVIGNADLLLLEPGRLSGETREQIKTIHSMALRLNEIMQRFSSLAAEMKADEKESQAETFGPAHSFMNQS